MKNIHLSIAILFFSQALFCQNEDYTVSKNQVQLSWGLGIPTSSDYLSESSLSGLRFEYKYFLNDNLALGISAGWNSFREKTEQQLYESEDGATAVFTDLVRHVYVMPVSLNVYYYFNTENQLKPYLGVGLGTQYAQQEAYFNDFVIDDTNWGFLFRPEIGLRYDINSDFSVLGYVSYNYATNSSDFFPVDDLQYIVIGLGMGWGF